MQFYIVQIVCKMELVRCRGTRKQKEGRVGVARSHFLKGKHWTTEQERAEPWKGGNHTRNLGIGETIRVNFVAFLVGWKMDIYLS